MCGITGFLTETPVNDPAGVLVRMNDSMSHRGPDGADSWLHLEGRLGLAHRRLAIVDLSEQGRQPMRSASGRYTITFNGEVYNFLQLRGYLEASGHSFRGGSDTEVMLASFENWGLAESLRRFVGMFAFALWDEAAQELVLARDRLGKKPLYYTFRSGRLLFGSELKALREFPGFDWDVDRSALRLYVRYGYVPAPWSMLCDVSKLRPGTFARFRFVDGRIRASAEEAYWDAETEFQLAGRDRPATMTDAVDRLDEVLRASVEQRLIADVPLGAFLSGGIDSSLVVALMQAVSPRPVRTYSIGFDEASHNEADHARAIATHLGTDHTEITVRPQDCLEVIPRLPFIFDEPFADSSQVPTFVVCQAARKFVTVALSGDGGDEAFLGYTRYSNALRIWRRLNQAPLPLRRALHAALRVTLEPAPSANALRRRLADMGSSTSVGATLLRRADVLSIGNPAAFYRRMVSQWPRPDALVLGGVDLNDVMSATPAFEIEELVERVALTDVQTYLPDDILVKVDRASMAVSLEVRAPLLDHRVVQFAWSLPSSMKFHDGSGKVILRQLLRRYVPQALWDRPKMGFGAPIDTWLRGPLRDWAASLLDPARLRREGYFDPRPVTDAFRQHQRGERNWHYQLWIILMFQAWLEKWDTARVIQQRSGELLRTTASQ